MKIENFSDAILENISNLLGDTNSGLTGTQIHKLLVQANIDDICVGKNGLNLSKRERLYSSLKKSQTDYKCGNNVLGFIKIVMTPSRFVGKLEMFENWLEEINKQLAFAGYEIKESGEIVTVQKTSTLYDVEVKAKNLKEKLEHSNAHREIFKYCKAELLHDNYFHAVFEANKGLFDRIRDLSGLQKDGTNLIEEVFSKNPILIINGFKSQSEINEHNGFCNLLNGLCGMFRNTTSHEPKINWPIEEQDAIEILGIISYCHRRIDNAQKIRLA